MTQRSLKNKRCAGYVRFSTSHQREESIEDQIRICEAYVKERGGVWVGAYSDAQRSGSTFIGRTGFADMMEAADRGEFEMLVIENLDRLSRQVSGTHAVIEELEALDIGIHTVHSGEVTDMSAAFGALQNADYVKNRSLKSRRGVEGTILNGRQSGLARRWGPQPAVQPC